jgi:predicted nucleotidyltransferase
MDRDEVIATLRAHQAELRAAGVLTVSLFGSVARRENSAHDADIVVRLDKNFSAPGIDYFKRLDVLERRLSTILGCKVDVVEEPVRKERFQKEIDRDRALAF